MSSGKNKFSRLSTFWKMSIISFVLINAIVLIVCIYQFIVFRIWTIDYEKNEIGTRSDEIIYLLSEKSFEEVEIELSQRMDIDTIVYDENNNILINTYSEIPYEFKFKKELSRKIQLKFGFVEEDEIELYDSVYIDGELYYMYVEEDSDLYTDLVEKTLPMMIFMFVVAFIISILAGMYISRQFLNKMKKLISTMEKVKQEGISSRITINNEKDEFDKVNIMFNDMMDYVENSFETQKQFVQDASHELRTPLTILKGHLKMLSRWGKDDKEVLENSLKVSIDEVDRLNKLVNDLLELGKYQEIINENEIEKIDVIKQIEIIENDFKIINRNIIFENHIEEVNIKMREDDFKQLLLIFIDNAIKYNDKEKIKINIRVFNDTSRTKIIIKDNGIGIKAEDIGKITEKFYRVDKSRKYNNSFGIGLSIAKKIINLYGYNLEIKSELTKGSEFIIICNN